MTAFPSLEDIRSGGKRALSRILTRIETEWGTADLAAFLDHAAGNAQAHVLGLTGPPGVGKSTLIDALIRSYRSQGERVCVLAIDPSSRFTGGALLGDRTRFQTNPDDMGVFVRSMAARDRLGGLSDHAMAAIAVLRAVSDRVIVESVGIGQSESDLAQAVDTVVLCIQPGSGDSLQFMKAGVMELPDLVAVTKSDMGQVARRAASDVAGALSLFRGRTDSWRVPVCELSARDGENIDDLLGHVTEHQIFLNSDNRLTEQRLSQHECWLEDMVRVGFGQMGLKALNGNLGDMTNPTTQPFMTFHAVCGALTGRLMKR